MKKQISSFLFVLLAIMAFGLKPVQASTPPDEGMWLPMFVERLNYSDMQKMGLQLTPEELYSINHSSLKDAIVGLAQGSAPNGYFCTGEIVSSKGLIFTNHHCGYGSIQEHSSVEHDYLTDGFWAYSLEEELPNPGLTASVLIRMEDVSEKILPELSDTMSEDARTAKIREISKELQETASEDGKYSPIVKSFFDGNEFYMFVYETYMDVRLVGAPPSSVGKYGGDTDNWMWPRHTGDFSIFRIYADKDGKPAEYSEDNVPLKPRHHLPVSIKGVEKEDFAMIWGFPGGTDRYLTSFGVDYAIEKNNPTVVKIRDKKLEVLREDMNADQKVKIMYSSKYAGTSNYWKYFIGQTKGLKRLNVSEKKQAIEKEFTNWVKQDPAREKKYGNALNLIKEGYEKMEKYSLVSTYLNEAVFQGPEIVYYCYSAFGLYSQLKMQADAKGKEKKAYDEDIKLAAEKMVAESPEHFKNFNLPTDRKLFSALLKMYYTDVPKDQQAEVFRKFEKKFKGDFDKWADYVYEKSAFASPSNLEAFMKKPSLKKLKKDPAFEIALSMVSSIRMVYQEVGEIESNYLDKGNRLFVAGLMEMDADRKFYPNANSTLRMTYGKVLDYYPADAIHYDFVTTLSGVMEKEDATSLEFVVSERLKELWSNKDFGRYGTKINGREDLVTCFLSTNDITGGNSGSPVMNANGELIGIAFDGNWEAMSGDIAFEDELQRTINVDVRYVLFIIDKYAGAKNLIEELDIVE